MKSTRHKFVFRIMHSIGPLKVILSSWILNCLYAFFSCLYLLFDRKRMNWINWWFLSPRIMNEYQPVPASSEGEHSFRKNFFVRPDVRLSRPHVNGTQILLCIMLNFDISKFSEINTINLRSAVAIIPLSERECSLNK